MLKVVMISVVFICLTTSSHSQAYTPFPDSNAVWVESHGQLQWSGICSNGGGLIYFTNDGPVFFGPDTMLNGFRYHTLWTYVDVHWQWISQTPYGCPSSGQYNIPTYLHSIIRQDVANRKVFIYDTMDEMQYLLYDFNMTVGTYPDTYNNFNYPNMEVTSIDSILLSDGYHRRFNLNISNWSDSSFVIEGMGSEFGVTALMREPFENHDRIHCFSINDQPLWVNTYYADSTTCDISSSIPDVQSNRVPVITYPNPFSEEISIDPSLPGNYGYKIWSISGQVIQQGIIQTRVIRTGTLPIGIFILEILDQDLMSISRIKIIKVEW